MRKRSRSEGEGSKEPERGQRERSPPGDIRRRQGVSNCIVLRVERTQAIKKHVDEVRRRTRREKTTWSEAEGLHEEMVRSLAEAVSSVLVDNGHKGLSTGHYEYEKGSCRLSISLEGGRGKEAALYFWDKKVDLIPAVTKKAQATAVGDGFHAVEAGSPTVEFVSNKPLEAKWREKAATQLQKLWKAKESSSQIVDSTPWVMQGLREELQRLLEEKAPRPTVALFVERGYKDCVDSDKKDAETLRMLSEKHKIDCSKSLNFRAFNLVVPGLLGSLYAFIASGLHAENGFRALKVGYTLKKLETRLSQYSGLETPLHVLLNFRCLCPQKVETFLHKSVLEQELKYLSKMRSFKKNEWYLVQDHEIDNTKIGADIMSVLDNHGFLDAGYMKALLRTNPQNQA